MNQECTNKVLLICPSVGLWSLNGRYFFDRKFYDGLKLYETLWGGVLRVVIRVSKEPTPQFGLKEYNGQNETFQLIVLEENQIVTVDELSDVSVVMASADDYTQIHISKLCRVLDIRCVYVIEYTLKTRLQIAILSKTSFAVKIKNVVWLVRQEFRLRKAIRLSSSIQSNGVPAYKLYGKLTKNPLLYFDTRNAQSMLISQEGLDKRLAYLDMGKPLRLGFSGRLIDMKGAHELIELACKLTKLNLAFSLDIFGAGEQAAAMDAKVNLLNLQNYVRLHGAVEYESELVPFVKESLDLFVCCHKQGDPSCTYLETYACGVPIAGFANEAHVGILDEVDVGWALPINDVEGLANLIVMLDKNREEIKIKAMAALAFAKIHTFEATFAARVEHCHQQLVSI
jgi:colanic acid/amylovoran biosynthesis glycosyltransferase